MTAQLPDIIDHLTGIGLGSRLDAIRNARPDARLNAQKSYLALFEPDDPGRFSLLERHAIAVFVTGLHGDAAVAAFYADRLASHSGGSKFVVPLARAAVQGAAAGPFGYYPRGPLSAEDKAGPVYQVGGPQRALLGERLAAALDHAHLLVFHPRDADAVGLQALLDAGWATSEIVTLSQIVAFLAFQIRVIAGLRLLAAA